MEDAYKRHVLQCIGKYGEEREERGNICEQANGKLERQKSKWKVKAEEAEKKNKKGSMREEIGNGSRKFVKK